MYEQREAKTLEIETQDQKKENGYFVELKRPFVDFGNECGEKCGA